LFRPAIQRNAAAIIVVHNHQRSPTPARKTALTFHRASGKLLITDVLDHGDRSQPLDQPEGTRAWF
jgi:DNA repair protein RadC